MSTLVRLLFLALPLLAGCAATPPEPASHDRYEEVASVLVDHGFAPPTRVRAADASIWMVSSRPGKTASRSMERVIVRLPGHAAPPEVEIRRYVRVASDWAILGHLFGDDAAAEARAIHDNLVSAR